MVDLGFMQNPLNTRGQTIPGGPLSQIGTNPQGQAIQQKAQVATTVPSTTFQSTIPKTPGGTGSISMFEKPYPKIEMPTAINIPGQIQGVTTPTIGSQFATPLGAEKTIATPETISQVGKVPMPEGKMQLASTQFTDTDIAKIAKEKYPELEGGDYSDTDIAKIMREKYPELGGQPQEEEYAQGLLEYLGGKKISTEREVGQFLDPLGKKGTGGADVGTALNLVGKSLLNLVPNAINFVKGVGSMIFHPKQTVEGLKSIGQGIIDQSQGESTTPQAKMVESLRGEIKDTVTDPQKLGQFIFENPLDILTVVSPKGVATLGKEAVKGIGKKSVDITRGIKGFSPIEKTAEFLTKTKGGQDKLFKAQSPTLNVLNKNRNFKTLRAESDLANELIVKDGHVPVDTETRRIAHEKTMGSTRKKVEEAVGNKEDYKVDQLPFAKIIDNFVTDAKKSGLVKNKADISALEAESKAMKSSKNRFIDMPTLEKKKQMINGIVNNRGDSSIGDVYKNGMKKVTRAIGETEEATLSKIPGEFSQWKKEFGALKATYEDVLKADLKNQKAKGMDLMESYSRLEGIGDIIGGTLSIFTKGSEGVVNVGKGIGKLFVGKVLKQMKDPDFLIEQGFKDLSSKIKPNVTSSIVPDVLLSSTSKKGNPIIPGTESLLKSNPLNSKAKGGTGLKKPILSPKMKSPGIKKVKIEDLILNSDGVGIAQSNKMRGQNTKITKGPIDITIDDSGKMYVSNGYNRILKAKDNGALTIDANITYVKGDFSKGFGKVYKQRSVIETIEEPLMVEARKYKSAEEFMLATEGKLESVYPSKEYKGHNTKLLYHGTTEGKANIIKEKGLLSNIERGGTKKGKGYNYVSFSDSPAHAYRFGRGRGENSNVLAIRPDKYKFMDINKDFTDKFGNNELKWTTKEVNSYIKSKGYDGLKFKAKDGNFNEYRLFENVDKSEIIDLKQIREGAHKGLPKVSNRKQPLQKNN